MIFINNKQSAENIMSSEPSSPQQQPQQPQPILSLVHPEKLEKKVRKKIVIVKNPNLKKQEAAAAAAAAIAQPPLPVDIYVILNHNKKYKPVLRELSRRTAWLHWLQKFDIVMRDFQIRAHSYIAHKEETVAAAMALPPDAPAAPQAAVKDTVIVIKKKKRKVAAPVAAAQKSS